MCGWNFTCLMQLFSWFSVTRDINFAANGSQVKNASKCKRRHFSSRKLLQKTSERFYLEHGFFKKVIWHWKKSCITYIADVCVCFICLSYNFMFIWWVFPETVQWQKSILKPFLFPHKVVLWYWLYSSCFGCSWFISAPPSAHVLKTDFSLQRRKLQC